MKLKYDEITDEDIQRILGKTDQTGECWIWLGGTNKAARSGYGHVWVKHSKQLAHRVMLMWHLKRDLTDGYEVDHLCKQRLCLNPTHLEEVTPNENKKRVTATVCARGHQREPRAMCKECAKMHRAEQSAAHQAAAVKLGIGVKQYRNMYGWSTSRAREIAGNLVQLD